MHHPTAHASITERVVPSLQQESADAAPPVDPDQLARAALPLVEAVARRLWFELGRWPELEEIAAMGRAALVPMVRAYDPALAPFAPYVLQRLHWAMRDGIRAMTHGRSAAARHGIAACRGHRTGPLRRDLERRMSRRAGRRAPVLASLLQPAAAASPEQTLAMKRRAEEVRRAVAALPRSERILVVGHYFQGRRFDHVAAHLGISKSWACRLHARALRRLERSLRPPSSRPRPHRPGQGRGSALPAGPAVGASGR